MDKKVKESIEIYGTVLLFVFVLLALGFMCGDSYRLHHPKSVDNQHEELMLKGEYNYCPYCGEKLKR